MVQSRKAFFGLGAFGLILSTAIACGNDTKAPPGGDSGSNDSGSSSANTGSGGTGTGGNSSGSGGTGGGASGGTGGDTSQATSASTTGAAGAGPVREDTGLAAPCETDDDCESAWTCMPPDESSYQVGDNVFASIPGGICTKECMTGADCQDDDEWSVCIGFSADDTQPGYCMPFCIPGDGVVECAQRPDMVCNLLPTGDNGGSCTATTDCAANQVCASSCVGVLPACLPNCATDSQCPSGRFCDPASGACLEEEPTGAAVGEVCADDTDCASQFCVEGLCTRICTLTVDEACGNNGVCLPSLDITTDIGDRGRCLSLCDCDSDCANDTCIEFVDSQLASLLGFDGFCGELLDGDVELTCN